MNDIKEYPLLENFSESLEIAEVTKNHDLVLEIQSLLKEGGFLLGKIDGKFEKESIAAYTKFKKLAYLEHPNKLGKTTATALLELDNKAIHPIPSEAAKKPIPVFNRDKNFRLPGGEVIFCNQKILGCQNFNWGEATKQGTRIPDSHLTVVKIIEIAEYLELVKTLFGNRLIFVTSWFRPKSINQQQGGVNNSRHIVGDGVDFIVDGIPPLDVFKKLHNWHGSRGGLGKSAEFTHIDRRGYYARWSY